MSYPYEWNLKDGYKTPPNRLKVFSTFACGGGSTMGYKLAGYEVIGCCEIDPKMIEVYKANHHPRFAYLEDIRKFKDRDDLPPELFDLDILDGSPPCSTFSTSGNREADWGKSKVFREGQTAQVLDDLFFEFIALAKRLQPKVIVAENVKGMLIGKAKGFVKEIVAALKDAGYVCQVFCLNAATMGVPQRRERAFFIARRSDLAFGPIKMEFNEPPITYREICSPEDKGETDPTDLDLKIWAAANADDKDYGDTNQRLGRGTTAFSSKFVSDCRVCNTIVSASGSKLVSLSQKRYLSVRELQRASTFPQDYNFLDCKPKYIMGMSVPPVMTAQIANQITLQWFQR